MKKRYRNMAEAIKSKNRIEKKTGRKLRAYMDISDHGFYLTSMSVEDHYSKQIEFSKNRECTFDNFESWFQRYLDRHNKVPKLEDACYYFDCGEEIVKDIISESEYFLSGRESRIRKRK